MIAQSAGSGTPLKDLKPYIVPHNTMAQHRRSGTLGQPQAPKNFSQHYARFKRGRDLEL